MTAHELAKKLLDMPDAVFCRILPNSLLLVSVEVMNTQS